MTETITKQRKGYAKPTERLTAAAALIGAGMEPKQAAATLGYSQKSLNGIKERIKEKGLDGFLTPKRVRKAVTVIDTFMQGKPVGRKVEEQIETVNGEEVRKTIILEPGVYPKDSTVKDCAMSVLDRAYPKQQEQGTTNISFTKIDLTVYQAPVNDNTPDIS
jgi:hypothetical protein